MLNPTAERTENTAVSQSGEGFIKERGHPHRPALYGERTTKLRWPKASELADFFRLMVAVTTETVIREYIRSHEGGDHSLKQLALACLRPPLGGPIDLGPPSGKRGELRRSETGRNN